MNTHVNTQVYTQLVNIYNIHTRMSHTNITSQSCSLESCRIHNPQAIAMKQKVGPFKKTRVACKHKQSLFRVGSGVPINSQASLHRIHRDVTSQRQNIYAVRNSHDLASSNEPHWPPMSTALGCFELGSGPHSARGF